MLGSPRTILGLATWAPKLNGFVAKRPRGDLIGDLSNPFSFPVDWIGAIFSVLSWLDFSAAAKVLHRR